MENRDNVCIRCFDPDHNRKAAAHRRWRRCGKAAMAVILAFSAVCAVAISLLPGGFARDRDRENDPTDITDEPSEDLPTDSDDRLDGSAAHGGIFDAELAALLEGNPEARDYVIGFDGVRKPDPELDLSDELEPDEIPYLSQLDPRWGYCRYDTGLIGWTGCGPTALSMVAMGLTGDGTLTPSFMADFASRNGYCVPGNGTAWLFFSEGASMLGLQAKELPLWEPTMRAELNAGRPIICIMGPGYFTTTGHYIVITDCDSDGFRVLDPARPSNCRVWAYDDISDEIRNLWSYALAQ